MIEPPLRIELVNDGAMSERVAAEMTRTLLAQGDRSQALAAMLIAAVVLANGRRPETQQIIDIVNDISTRIVFLLSPGMSDLVTPAGETKT